MGGFEMVIESQHTRAVSDLVESRAWLGIGSACESVPALTGKSHASRVFV
jgi:hypothetical protein